MSILSVLYKILTLAVFITANLIFQSKEDNTYSSIKLSQSTKVTLLILELLLLALIVRAILFVIAIVEPPTPVEPDLKDPKPKESIIIRLLTKRIFQVGGLVLLAGSVLFMWLIVDHIISGSENLEQIKEYEQAQFRKSLRPTFIGGTKRNASTDQAPDPLGQDVIPPRALDLTDRASDPTGKGILQTMMAITDIQMEQRQVETQAVGLSVRGSAAWADPESITASASRVRGGSVIPT